MRRLFARCGLPRPIRRLARDWTARRRPNQRARAKSTAARAKEGEEDLASLSKTLEAEPVSIPGLAGSLRPYQNAAVRYALQSRCCFIADEMGTGKTVQALACIEAAQAYPAVVVTPLVTKTHWERHAAKWVPGRSVRTISGRKKRNDTGRVGLRFNPEVICGWPKSELERELKRRELPYSGANKQQLQDRLLTALEWERKEKCAADAKAGAAELEPADIVFINYDILESWEPSLTGQVRSLVLDESHYIKNPGARRSKAALRLGKSLRQQKDGMVLLLTGTPVTNRPCDIIHQLNVLGKLTEMGGWFKFVRRYCQGYKDRFGWNIDGASNLDELHEKLRASCYLRRTKDQVLKHLPPLQWVDVVIEDADKASRKKYDKAEEDVIAYLESEMAAAVPEVKLGIKNNARIVDEAKSELRRGSAEHLVRLLTLRRLANTLKLPRIFDWIDDFAESGEKLVVFAHHIDVIHALLERYKESLGAVAVYGQMEYADKMESVDKFQEDPDTKIIVCSLRGASVGIELTAAANILFVEQDWSPAVMDQAAGRAHRGGQTRPVTLWVALAKNTIDEDVSRVIRSKRRAMDELLDGSPDGMDSAETVADNLLFSFAGIPGYPRIDERKRHRQILSAPAVAGREEKSEEKSEAKSEEKSKEKSKKKKATRRRKKKAAN